jgi:hypothetical protein
MGRISQAQHRNGAAGKKHTHTQKPFNIVRLDFENSVLKEPTQKKTLVEGFRTPFKHWFFVHSKLHFHQLHHIYAGAG